jgi:SynChlorMet cassette radical SAM/SPASM protein ScmE
MKVMNTPRSLSISITNKCNLRCQYCDHFSSPSEASEELPLEEWRTFFKELNRCAVMRVSIEGGEPLLRHDLQAIIESIIDNKMRFSILSNGTLITDEMASFLSATGRCSSVQVSIDGSTAEAHDSLRGQGSFGKAIEGLQRLRRHQIPVSTRVTIHQHNVDDLGEIARLLLEELELPSFSTNAASYSGLCRQNAKDVQLTVEQRSRAMETLVGLYQKYNGRITASAGPLRNAFKWRRMERQRRENSAASGGYLIDCGGVMTELGVRADGIMVPCLLLSHIELGRINTDDLRSVWQSHPELERMRKRRSISVAEIEFCEGCDYIPYCTGNCPAYAYDLVGRDDRPNPDDCLKRFLDAGGRLPSA